MSAMTKKEWMEYLEKTWDAAQKEAWSEPQFECPRCGHCCQAKLETPPKKQWVGLTEEEREFLLHQALRFYDTNAQLLSFIKTVEEKLKEKNT